jgi:hypothetical protein
MTWQSSGARTLVHEGQDFFKEKLTQQILKQIENYKDKPLLT